MTPVVSAQLTDRRGIQSGPGLRAHSPTVTNIVCFHGGQWPYMDAPTLCHRPAAAGGRVQRA
jgi:hypothetical protein